MGQIQKHSDVPLETKGFKDKFLSAYKTWFWLSIVSGVALVVLIVVRSMNELTLTPLLLQAMGDPAIRGTVAFQNAFIIEEVLGRTWMQLGLLSLSFMKIAIAGAVHVSIKRIRVRRAREGDVRKPPNRFHSRFYPISEVIGSESQLFNFLAITLVGDFFLVRHLVAQFAGTTNLFANTIQQLTAAASVPLEFWGASFSLAGIVFALATYASEPKSASDSYRSPSAGLLALSYTTLIAGLTGLLFLLPFRASAILTQIRGVLPGGQTLEQAIIVDQVLLNTTEQWLFVGVGGLFFAWALWTWQAGKKDHKAHGTGSLPWTNRIIPGLAIVGYGIVVANFILALFYNQFIVQLVQQQVATGTTPAIILSVMQNGVTVAMFKMVGIGLILLATGFGSVSILSSARVSATAANVIRQSRITSVVEGLRSVSSWRYWWIIIPGAILVFVTTIPGTIMMENLMTVFGPTAFMGAPPNPDVPGAFQTFRLLRAMGPPLMMFGLILMFAGAARYMWNIADNVWRKEQ